MTMCYLVRKQVWQSCLELLLRLTPLITSELACVLREEATADATSDLCICCNEMGYAGVCRGMQGYGSPRACF